jgi:hypothetical protein
MSSHDICNRKPDKYGFTRRARGLKGPCPIFSPFCYDAPDLQADQWSVEYPLCNLSALLFASIAITLTICIDCFRPRDHA